MLDLLQELELCNRKILRLRNFASIITSSVSRGELLEALQAESGRFPPLINRVSEIAQQFHVDSEQLSRIVSAELMTDSDEFLREIVLHPNIDEPTLTMVLESVDALLNLRTRSGPPWLLERLAREHRISEAILTLLVNHYATDSYTDAQFVDFVRAYRDVAGVRFEIEKKKSIPEAKRQSGQRVLDGL